MKSRRSFVLGFLFLLLAVMRLAAADMDFYYPNARWSRPLRGGGQDTAFVSFFVYGSTGTTIDVAGAKLVVHASDKPGYAQIKAGTVTPQGVTWREIGGPVKLEKFDGASLAALPVLTLRLDRAARVWDIYVATKLAIVGLPCRTCRRARRASST